MKRFLILFLVVWTCNAFAQNNVNYDETQVPSFNIPNLLECNDGTIVTSPQEWEIKRRPEILEYFFSQEYGRTRHDKVNVSYHTLAESSHALRPARTHCPHCATPCLCGQCC